MPKTPEDEEYLIICDSCKHQTFHDTGKWIAGRGLLIKSGCKGRILKPCEIKAYEKRGCGWYTKKRGA